MTTIPWRLCTAFLFLLVAPCAFAKQKCVTAEEASKLIDKDVCVSAHIYEVIELPSGTRYLDVCPPDTSDDLCHFTLISYREDRNEVGELSRFRDMDVRVRGRVRSLHGRTAIVVSHVRQLYGGPPKFRPNPMLARGFTAEQNLPPIYDPNLRRQGGGRGFMNNRDQVERPVK